jgi:hypothetical protein
MALALTVERGTNFGLLTDGTGNGGKDVVGVPTNQANGADHDHQNNGQHDRVFGYILSSFIRP